MSLNTISTNPSAIWSYPTRTLSQTKFPFWSAIILPQNSSVSIASGGTLVSVSIQPPSGETWWIFLNAVIDYVAANYLKVYDYDGTTKRLHTEHNSGGSYGDRAPHSETSFIITNSIWITIDMYNTGTSSCYGYYGYSGFKLSQPQWSPKRLNDPTPPWKRKTTQFPIPDAVKAIADRIVDIYDFSIGDYRQAIILEEDTPLAVDPKTSFPVEGLTAIAYVDEFIKNILTPYKQGTLDLVKSGWKKYEAILASLVRS